MPNLKDDLLAATGGKELTTVVFVSMPYRYNGDYEKWALAKAAMDRPLSWAEAAPMMDVEYDDGWGSQDCPDFHAWTSTDVYFIHEYDGSTSIISVPRNPPAVTAP